MLESRGGSPCILKALGSSSRRPRIPGPYFRLLGRLATWDTAGQEGPTKAHQMILLRESKKQSLWNDTLVSGNQHPLCNDTLVNYGYLLWNDTLAILESPQLLSNDTLVKKGGGRGAMAHFSCHSAPQLSTGKDCPNYENR